MKRIDSLKEKKAELQEAAARERLTTLLERVTDLQFVGFTDEKKNLVSARLVFMEFVRYDAKPFSRIWDSASGIEKQAWLLSCLRVLGLETNFFITLGRDPWAEINGDGQGHWLPHLWSQPGVEDMIVMSSDGQRALAIVSDEDCLLAITDSVRGILEKRASRTE